MLCRMRLNFGEVTSQMPFLGLTKSRIFFCAGTVNNLGKHVIFLNFLELPDL